ncbi:MAG: response regulator transcription factor [Chloroflexota bacterium]
MNGATVLVVDDEERMRQLLRLYLESDGYRVVEAATGTEALASFEQGGIDIVLLDLMLPDTDGRTVCRTLRASSSVPIIMLTALGSESERLLGFDLGADDYVVKPFSPREVVYRVRALLRRTGRTGGQSIIRHGALEIDQQSRIVRCGSHELALTPKEYDMLVLLASHPRQAFSRDQLLNDVWGYDYYGDQRTVDTHVKNLRDKLGPCSALIVTVWGVGYRLDPTRGEGGDARQ